MFANWVQIAELALLPLGLGIGYGAGRICRRDERASFGGGGVIRHPGLAPEYLDRDAFFVTGESDRFATGRPTR
ncbi:hypothetical protein ACFQ05_22675 [Amycolatopsis umgeniensis]|uniref:Uncharacterized protein n=1 Tax=Amycolatopsis umgeniensis TaxID=336628 RepID=A0A841ATN2_9PSEU|nr:hypothetical protein [Amycolatopsis umgeniensis]MBB5850011.1 hypothetical protein [Amycolatopsis umgeniensis]